MIRRTINVFLAALLGLFFSACAVSVPQNDSHVQSDYRQPSVQPQEILNTIEDWHNQCLASGGNDCRMDIVATTDGWQVKIGVAGIGKSSSLRQLPGFKMNSRNWMECQVDANYFVAKGSKNNLLNIMNAFYQWMRKEANGKK
jgi:hypothetical protein